jgi:hypothetical protein
LELGNPGVFPGDNGGDLRDLLRLVLCVLDIGGSLGGFGHRCAALHRGGGVTGGGLLGLMAAHEMQGGPGASGDQEGDAAPLHQRVHGRPLLARALAARRIPARITKENTAAIIPRAFIVTS